MSGDHFEDWELAAYLDACSGEQFDAGEIDVVNMSEHITTCAKCEGVVDELRSLNEALQDESVHLAALGPDSEVDELLLAEARAIVEEMSAEAAVADNTVQELSQRDVSEWTDYLDANPTLRSAGLVRRLIADARSEYERRPSHGLEVLLVAACVAARLSDSQARTSERGAVARERANALRFLGRYSDALDELDFAEQLIVHLPLHAFDLAQIEWSRATVLFFMTRYDDASVAVKHAIRLFRQFGDVPRVNEARMLEAGIAYEQGNVEAAFKTWSELAAYFVQPQHEATLARITANIAECEMRLGWPSDARRHANEAIAKYATLNNVTERTRAEWIIAHSYLMEGELALAEDALTNVRDRFVALEMRSEAAEVLLDLIQVHVQRFAWSQAAKLSGLAASEFIAMQSPVHVANALAYLYDAVRNQQATPALVEYVRRFVAEGDVESHFVPPRHG